MKTIHLATFRHNTFFVIKTITVHLMNKVMQQKAHKYSKLKYSYYRLFARCFDKNSARVKVCVKFSHDGMQGAFDKTRKGKRR